MEILTGKKMKYVAMFATLLIAFTAQSNNKQFVFQVLFATDLVNDEIAAEDYKTAVEILEARALDPSGTPQHNELSTLCGLYVLTKQLADAYDTCNAAVATDRSDTAYNNRGVLRVHMKNISGALNDFRKSKSIYLNAIILADTNRSEALRFAEARDRAAFNALTDRIGTAEVETLQ